MSLEPIGVITILVGLLCVGDLRLAGAAVVIAALLGSAAALLIGGATIQPAHLMLGFAGAAMVRRRHEAATAVAAVLPGQPGFWLLGLVAYGVLGGVLMPRLFAETTLIIPLGTSAYEPTQGGVPLGPVSSNFTQAVYVVADLFCFGTIVAVASSRSGFEAITRALLAYVAGNAAFAVLDVATYSTGTQGLFDIIRNAQYTLHDEEEIAGLKRIVGSFPEASAFAHSTLGALGFVGTLWLCRRLAPASGLLAATSLVLVVLSTSSTGLVGTAVVLALLYATALGRCGTHPLCRTSSATVLLTPLVVAAVALVVLLDEPVYATVRHYVDLLVLSKSTSDSGIERASWNVLAMRNFWDTGGLGVGLGTVRTSSLPVALLSNVGVPGTVLYLLFVASALLRRRGRPLSFASDVRLAARNGCASLIVADVLAAPSVEQGLLFFVFAALACADPGSVAPAVSRRRDPAAATPQPYRLEGGPAGHPSGGPASRPNT